MVLPAGVQGEPDVVEERLFAERLPEEVDRSRFHGAILHLLAAVGADEDDGNHRIGRGEPALQIEAADTGQFHVENEAARGPIATLEELFSRSKRVDAQARRSNQTPQRPPDRLVVVDD
jgi:hypothetical protein